MNSWASLKLWADGEEKELHACIVEALQRLAESSNIKADDDEPQVTGKLRPFLYQVRKKKHLAWTLHFEASSFFEVTDPIPSGHPDIRFSGKAPDSEQYDYDIECKLVRIKRIGKSRDYCKAYVVNGIRRYQNCTYAASLPAMGAMVGYVQEGNFCRLFEAIQQEVTRQKFGSLNVQEWFAFGGISKLTELLTRTNDQLLLNHIWIDLR